VRVIDDTTCCESIPKVVRGGISYPIRYRKGHNDF
jgi:hypothetical protein